jgi:hypothetical protein
MKITNVFGMEFSGTIGKKLTASSWKGIQYIRAYAKPRNPRTERQESHRAMFKAAVETWHGLTDRQREFYNRIARDMTGCNLFVSRYIKAVRDGGEPEIPIVIRWTVRNRTLPRDSWFIVRRQDRMLFTDALEVRRGEIALTRSDAPYTFVLRKDRQEDAVHIIDDLLGTEIPMTLESKTLGIKLIADV